MNLEYRHIIQSHSVLGPNNELIVLGLADDGWMYQFLGELGKWERLSKAIPGQIMLPGHESLSTPVIQVEEAAPAEPQTPPEQPVA